MEKVWFHGGNYTCLKHILSSNEGWELFAWSELLWEAADTRVKCKNNTRKIILVILTRLQGGAMKSTDTDQRPKRDVLRWFAEAVDALSKTESSSPPQPSVCRSVAAMIRRMQNNWQKELNHEDVDAGCINNHTEVPVILSPPHHHHRHHTPIRPAPNQTPASDPSLWVEKALSEKLLRMEKCEVTDRNVNGDR